MQIRTSAVKCLLNATSDDKARVSLNGVHFTKQGTAVATNGHILAVHKNAIEDADEMKRPKITVHSDALKTAIKMVKTHPTIGLGFEEKDRNVTLFAPEGRFSAADYELDLEFPNYQAVLDQPKKVNMTIGLMVETLERVLKLAKQAAGKSGVLKLEIKDGENQIWFSIVGNEDLNGVFMPCRLAD